MGKLILITGGARSGKSSYAEKLAKELKGDILYVATSIPFDEEMKLRIKKHVERRPESWETLEAYKDFHSKLIPMLNGKSGVLLDCITNLVSNLLLEKCEDTEKTTTARALEIEKYIKAEVSEIINISKEASMPFIMVTNEVGMALVPEYPLGRIFRDLAGSVNQMIAKEAEEVYFCISGIPLKIK
ncbi:bifunctional adenosylcobinamide kinase/adenosylcobinamide-phosphate guanylyltransferase [Clostridium kluyveri]|uniref:Adenosylcobinamide kinase n=1 Tax=Clostridium kluyveri TaxID=1534 RepID=A0A1L5F533_CLOKL|nr:bifunctional adenosylcobinamide kinase/adenosylcobinamide-phosphate guanylyltransferase [Clostridium kluyveri]APM38114.1 bifunctional adenosylcobinamide kinase/adenosylcobinamide-phosphate guanylyltransferase [Clostridium kluyveri]